MSRYKDLTGQKFGRLTAIKYAGPDKFQKATWLCKCYCGKEVVRGSAKLIIGETTSCGCLYKDMGEQRKNKYRHENPRLYAAWMNMKNRCRQPKSGNYRWYGEKGIKVCDKWKDFKPFYEWALQNGYQDNLTIDRIYSTKDYSPDNCRWVDMQTQANNTSRNINITYKGETKTLTQWARKLNINYGTLAGRHKRGKAGEELFKPVVGGVGYREP